MEVEVGGDELAEEAGGSHTAAVAAGGDGGGSGDSELGPVGLKGLAPNLPNLQGTARSDHQEPAMGEQVEVRGGHCNSQIVIPVYTIHDMP